MAVRILLIGSGGREHALALALAQDETNVLFAAPGNPGIAQLAECHPLDILDPQAAANLAQQLAVDLVIVGPEAPLVAGVADAIRDRDIAVFGPSKAAAQLEGSKAFAKQVMAAANVPTSLSYVCDTEQELRDALNAFGAPHVVKDDGLAAGKGVVVTDDFEEALAHGLACVGAGGADVGASATDEATTSNEHTPAGRVVVEEFLDGPEISLFCLSDGQTVIPLEPAQDFKRAYDDNTGPNTGGMGAYSPLPWAPEDLTEQVVTRVAQPVITQMAKQGTPFVGLLYCGLALTERGIRVIEFNARFGDPETQVILPRLKTPLAPVLLAAAEGRLDESHALSWSDEAAVTVVLAAPGYPANPETGGEITGLKFIGNAEVSQGAHIQVVHAGTALVDGKLVSSGGRVLCVVGLGEDLADARAHAYGALREVRLEGGFYRSDIAANRYIGQGPKPPTAESVKQAQAAAAPESSEGSDT